MPKTKYTIVITGAGGFLGSALVSYFAKKGFQVRALVRDPAAYYKKAGVTYEAYDMTKPLNESYFKDADFFVHTAYIKYDREHPDALEANVVAAKQLIKAARRYKLRKNMFVSSMSAHNAAESVYGRQKLAVEKLFNKDTDIILRSGLMIGNGGIVKQMVEFMRSKHAVPMIDGGRQPLQIIAIQDLLQVIDTALNGPQHGLFVVATPEVYSYKHFYKSLAKSLGTPVVFVPIPFSLLAALLKLASAAHLPLGVGMDNALGLKQLIAVDNKGDLDKLGITLRDLDQALKASGIAKV